jgi:hypothetical protein
MFFLPKLQPCDGLPVWVVGDDELAEALVLWWPAGSAWALRRPEEAESA